MNSNLIENRKKTIAPIELVFDNVEPRIELIRPKLQLIFFRFFLFYILATDRRTKNVAAIAAAARDEEHIQASQLKQMLFFVFALSFHLLIFISKFTSDI